MLELWEHLPSSDFMPHGHCYLWTPILVWTEVVANLSIGLAYMSISATLAYLVHRVRDLPFQWMYLAFGVFIVTCGFTHFMDVWVIWRPNYWLDASIRIVTAVASVGTAVLLFPLIPKALALADAARLAHERGVQLEDLNRELAALYEQTRETLAEAIPQLVWTATPGGRVDYVNQRWIDYTGARTLGVEWLRAVHPEDAPRAAQAWNEALASGSVYETEYRLQRSDGTYRWFLARALPLRADGGIVKWFGTCTDIHDRKLLAEERERLLARAYEDVRARDTFLAIAAHELKTPLTPLRLEIEMILRAARAGRADRLAPDKLAGRLSLVEQQIHRLERLVANLLDVTRLTTGQFELHREDVDLGALVREVLERHRGDVQKAGATISLEAPPSIVARVDRLRIDQVVTNLLTNALAYGGGAPIAVTLSAPAGMVRIDVTDQGPGIAPEDQARIFERFERATSERHGGGLGLGLWLIRRIVEAHGGTVEVESAPSHGARFTVRLPLS